MKHLFRIPGRQVIGALLLGLAVTSTQAVAQEPAKFELPDDSVAGATTLCINGLLFALVKQGEEPEYNLVSKEQGGVFIPVSCTAGPDSPT